MVFFIPCNLHPLQNSSNFFSIFATVVFANQPIIHRDNSVGIATRQKLSGPFSNPDGGKQIFVL